MIISLIVAMSENRVIGRDQKLPWNIPIDLKRFRAITSGHLVIMGRKTFDSIGKPLPNRTNVVITRNADFKYEGVVVVDSIENAIEPYKKTNEEIFILGGGDIFKQTIDKADRLYLTLVHKEVDGDVYFPEFNASLFELTFREDHVDPMPFSFLDYKRK
ncbi:MAG: dihydrofolate reductase [Oligoflexia bacterium]|nr:dihydrofolate reductase [Oligoflexia bacterium]